MELQDICEIKTNFPNADFWVNLKKENGVNLVTKSFKKEYIGIKLERTDLFVVDFLYYYLEYKIGKLVMGDNNISKYLVNSLSLTTQ